MTTPWLRTARIFALESWWPPFWPRIEIDWDRALATMRRLHLDTLQVNALTKYASLPGDDGLPRLPGLGDRDLVAEGAGFARRHGFRWILYSTLGGIEDAHVQAARGWREAYVPTFAGQYAFQQAWPQTAPPSQGARPSIFAFGGDQVALLCPIANRERHTALLRLLHGRDPDAVWIDATDLVSDQYSNPCRCPRCQDDYRARFGHALPEAAAFTPQLLAAFTAWKRPTIIALAREAVTLLGGDDRPVVSNVAQPRLPGTFPELLSEIVDAGLFEHAADDLGLLMKASGARRTVDSAILYPDVYDPWPRRVTSGPEVVARGLGLCAVGATPYLAQPGKYYYDASNDAPAARLFHFIKRHADVLAVQRPSTWAVVAAAAGTLPDALEAEHRHAGHGWGRLLADRHLPLSTCPVHRLADPPLADTRVLILPELLLGDAPAAAIAQAVAGGLGCWVEGRSPHPLLAQAWDLVPAPSDRASLTARARNEGISGSGDPRLTYDLVPRARADLPADLASLAPGDDVLATHRGDWLPGPSWTVLADLVAGDGLVVAPLLAVRQHGKGRVVWCSAQLGRTYGETRQGATGAAIERLLLWLAQAPPPLQVQADTRLWTLPAHLDDGLVLYLVNTTASRQEPRRTWFQPMTVGAEPLPLGAVTVRVPGSAVESLEGPAPTMVRDGDTLVLRWPAFTDHAVVRIRS